MRKVEMTMGSDGNLPVARKAVDAIREPDMDIYRIENPDMETIYTSHRIYSIRMLEAAVKYFKE